MGKGTQREMTEKRKRTRAVLFERCFQPPDKGPRFVRAAAEQAQPAQTHTQTAKKGAVAKADMSFIGRGG